VVQYHGPSEAAYCAYKLSTCGAAVRAAVLSPKEFQLSKHMLAPEEGFKREDKMCIS